MVRSIIKQKLKNIVNYMDDRLKGCVFDISVSIIYMSIIYRYSRKRKEESK